MRRLIAMLALSALLGGALAVGDAAQGKDRNDPRGNEGRQAREAPSREAPMRAAPGRDARGGDFRDSPPYPQPSERRVDTPPPAYSRDDRRTYPPQAYAPPPRVYREEAPAARRGGYLPPEATGGIVGDLNRYQLRPPPRGYAWVRVNGGFAMVSMATGQIFDIVPN